MIQPKEEKKEYKMVQSKIVVVNGVAKTYVVNEDGKWVEKR